MKIPILRLNFDEEDISFIKSEVEKVIRSGVLTMGERVVEFEKQFAAFCGVKYAISTNSGTSALEIILRTIGVEGATVVVPSNTYMATPIAVIKAGGRVIFAECEKDNLQLDPNDLEQKIRSDTKAVIIVHIGGIISPNLGRIKEICTRRNLPLIEDAAHAHGADLNGKKAGSFGRAGSFSFYPTKVLTTAEGGMITTDNEEIYKKALILREHGKLDHRFNEHVEFGDNWRSSEIHAVLGIQQMKKVDWILDERRRLASLYDGMLEDVNGVKCLLIPSNIRSAYYKYIAFLDHGLDRDVIKKKLHKKYDISLSGEVYANPCHSQPVFRKYPDKMVNSKDDVFSATDYVCKQHICLPIYPGLTEKEVVYVVKSLKEVIQRIT